MYPYVHNGRNVIFAYAFISCGSEVVTAAYTKSEDGKTVEVAYSLCSWKDTFTKARGRQITLGRLAKGQTLTFEDDKTIPVFDQVMDRFPEYSKTVHQMPQRVVRQWDEGDYFDDCSPCESCACEDCQ
jgi:hypothetical protein